ncbi:UDP-glucose 4-epimerase GalE [Alicyclobacillus fodiniaquatilis]|uniref:UDP-glucose 4-epimerase n=1 Tax=Alicyclobacillus fodiniaquatilis TaxID=1661150 RepID=A0ABW4JFM4_9BACL
MTILVTGGAGYIGSHTCVVLLNAGYDIAVLDSFPNSKPKSLQRVREITGKDFPVYAVDLLDRQGVEQVFVENQIEAVIHFAALKAVGESVAKPLTYYHNNLTGTLILCQVMQQYNVRRFVFSSSAAVYGAQERVPITEDMPLAPINPYGQTKVMIEQILQDICTADPSWSVALLRYFNPVGAHPSGRIGEDPNGIPNNLVPYVTQVAVGKLKELRIFGDDYPTPDGTGIRDYIHVMDLANGHLKALEWVKERTGAETFNLGTGEGYSVLDIIHAFERATGVPIPYQVVARRPGDAAVSYADPSKAKKLLGWQAEKQLIEMCADAWRWQQNNPNGYIE